MSSPHAVHARKIIDSWPKWKRDLDIFHNRIQKADAGLAVLKTNIDECQAEIAQLKDKP
ncbi:MAG TPA: hypothetical protein VMV58_01040 [Desulfosporosinus sp.]|nr:hypothetical protein [Desulfosporosinus sp.]